MIQVIGGVAVGAAAMMLAPSIMSVVGGALKPVAKTIIKGGLLAIESGKKAIQESRCALAGAVESIEDLAAEAQAELAAGQKELAKTSKKKAA
jgi:hypothetical protein